MNTNYLKAPKTWREIPKPLPNTVKNFRKIERRLRIALLSSMSDSDPLGRVIIRSLFGRVSK